MHAGCERGSEPAAPARVEAVASAVDLEGAAYDPLAASDGSAVVLVFVATACPISNRYAPTLSTLAETWASPAVRTWLVYPDPDDDAAAIRAHRAAYGLELAALRDPDHVLVARAGAKVTPEAAVFATGSTTPAYRGRIDDRVLAFGKIRAQASTHELRDAVDAVVRGDAPAVATAPAVGCYISDLK